MELKEGMYARTEDGIKEIIDYEYDDEYENGHKIHFKGNKYGLIFTKEELPKCSWDLTDLIEVGDYVNGSKVKYVGGYIELDHYGDEFIELNENEKIKSIVTKEQFESISYKVGE